VLVALGLHNDGAHSGLIEVLELLESWPGNGAAVDNGVQLGIGVGKVALRSPAHDAFRWEKPAHGGNSSELVRRGLDDASHAGRVEPTGVSKLTDLVISPASHVARTGFFDQDAPVMLSELKLGDFNHVPLSVNEHRLGESRPGLELNQPVISPAEDAMDVHGRSLYHGARKHLAHADRDGPPDEPRDARGNGLVLDGPITQLTVVVVAPAKDLSAVDDGAGMYSPAGQGGHVLQSRDERRGINVHRGVALPDHRIVGDAPALDAVTDNRAAVTESRAKGENLLGIIRSSFCGDGDYQSEDCDEDCNGVISMPLCYRHFLYTKRREVEGWKSDR